MNYIIYKITNIINGKIYIGQTTKSISHRWKRHQYKSNCTKLSNAIQKYGPENFKIEEIERCNSIEELNKRETFWIKELNTLEEGYNLVTNGNNKLVSEETKRKLSKNSKEMCKKSKYRTKMSKIAKERWEDPEYRKKHKKSMKKIHSKEEYRKKKSISAKRNWQDPEWAANQCKLRKEQWEDPKFMEFKKNQLASFWKRPGYKDKMSKKSKECKLKQNAKSFNAYKAICIQPAKRNQKAIYEKGEYIGTWENKSTCAEDLNIKRRSINSCLSDRPASLKTYKGYLFEYT